MAQAFIHWLEINLVSEVGNKPKFWQETRGGIVIFALGLVLLEGTSPAFWHRWSQNCALTYFPRSRMFFTQ